MSKKQKEQANGTNLFRRILKKIKKFFKTLWYRIVFLFKPDFERIPKKYRKKFQKKRGRKRGKRLSSFATRIAELAYGYKPETNCRLEKEAKKAKKHAGKSSLSLSFSAA